MRPYLTFLMWGNGKNGFPQEPQPPPNLFLKGTIDEDFKEMAQKFVESMFSTNSVVAPIDEALPHPPHVGEWEERFPTRTAASTKSFS